MNMASGVRNYGEGEVLLGEESLGKGEFKLDGHVGEITIRMPAMWRWQGLQGKTLSLLCDSESYSMILPPKRAFAYRDITSNVKRYQYNRDTGKVDTLSEPQIIHTKACIAFRLEAAKPR